MSRTKRKAIFVLLFLLVAVYIGVDRSVYHVLQSRREITEPTPQRDFAKYHGQTFTVVHVVDGDTLDIDVPDGNDSHTRIRLLGVDTPETKNPRTGPMYFGKEAAEFARELAMGKEVTVFLDTQDNTRGKYGRLLAYVQLPDDTFLNEQLLLEGFAYADLRFRHSNYHTYQQLESAARATKKGLWQNVRQDQLPPWLQQRKPTLIK